MKYCCDKMKNFLHKDQEKADADKVMFYSSKIDEYGIVIPDGGKSYITISYCPWCGRKLPISKRDRWFEELEKKGIDDPFSAIIPKEYYTDEWWKKLGQ